MNHGKLHNQKLFEIINALQGHGLPVDDFHIKRMAALMRFHLVQHDISLTAWQAGDLFKLEIAEFIVKKHGPNYIYVSFTPGMN